MTTPGSAVRNKCKCERRAFLPLGIRDEKAIFNKRQTSGKVIGKLCIFLSSPFLQDICFSTFKHLPFSLPTVEWMHFSTFCRIFASFQTLSKQGFLRFIQSFLHFGGNLRSLKSAFCKWLAKVFDLCNMHS